jgi:hypothetical protein
MSVIDLTAAAASLKRTLPTVRRMVGETDPARMKTAVNGAELTPTQIVVGLYRLETRLIRPAVTQMLDADMPSLPAFDLPLRAKKEGFGAYDVAKTIRAWGETRTGSVMMVESLDEPSLERPGSVGGRLTTIGDLLVWWLAEEAKWMKALGGVG